MAMLSINKDNFQAEILNSERDVLLDFWAPWCGPCRMVSPLIEEIAEENPGVTVAKINVDQQPELAQAFRITSIPALVVMKNGKVIRQSSGARPKQAILDLLKGQ